MFFSKSGDRRPVSPVVKDTATAYADSDERIRNDIQLSYSVSAKHMDTQTIAVFILKFEPSGCTI